MKKIYKFLIDLFSIKAKKTLLEHPIYIEGRRNGTTTRLADKYVQDFFNKGFCITLDHHESREASKRLLFIVKDRLAIEHNIIKTDIIVDRKEFKITRI